MPDCPAHGDDLDLPINAIREFNRFYTQRIGVLDESLLESGFSLTQARVLFEIGTREACTAGCLISLLKLDAGYLSRILQEFVDASLVKRRPCLEDGRRSFLTLTAKGRKRFKQLDRQSRRRIGELIIPLSPRQRIQLLHSMQAVTDSLSVVPQDQVSSVNIRPYLAGDIGWAIERHGKLYSDEFGWNMEFEALVATLFAKFASKHDPATEQFWVAELDGERVGCVFVVRSERDEHTAQLRCLLVDPKARGQGVGKQLVDECIQFSKSSGYRQIMLWTNDVLVSARRIYQAAGFALIEESAHRSFGRDLIGQFWSRAL